MEKNDLLKYREYHWEYFSLHADQRLKTFNFYLVISALLIGAFFNILIEEKNHLLLCILPYLLSLISYIFWKLDIRTKYMIKNSEEAIKLIDDKLIQSEGEIPSVLNIFRYDDFLCDKRRKGIFKGYLSYSQSFNIMFLLFGLSGFLIGTFILLNQLFCN